MHDELIHITIKIDSLNKIFSKSIEHINKFNFEKLSNIADIILSNTAKNLSKDFSLTFNVFTLELIMLSDKEAKILFIGNKKILTIPLYVKECSFRYQGMNRIVDNTNLSILLSTIPICQIITDLL